MKKTLSMLLVAAMLIQCVFCIGYAETVLTGEGTEGSPYLIGSLDELVAFRDKVNGGETTACAQLTADIAVGQWTPIGTEANKYAGTFNGKGFAITEIEGSGEKWGFFAYANGAVIENLIIKAGNNGNLRLGHQSALFVPFASGDTVIRKCAGYANLSGSGWIGGITCREACTVTDCYFVGDISGTGWVTGMGFGAVATNCFVYGNIKSPDTAFKVANGSGTDKEKNFYLSMEAVTPAGYGTQKSAEAFASGEVASLLGASFGQTLGTDKHPVFKTETNEVYANGLGGYSNIEAEDGSVEKPYSIGSVAALEKFRSLVNAGSVNLNAKLIADIDLNSAVWTPIGTSDYKYAGVFDGNGFAIKEINGSGTQWGFFKYTNGGEIKNLTIEAGNNGTVNVGHQSALFVAIAENNTKITKCAGYGNISIADGYVGGITCQGACTVTDCYFVGNIKGANWVTGMGFNAVATNCFVYGTIKGTATAFKVANGSGTSNDKNFYIAVEAPAAHGYGTQKSAEAFASGEVANLLGNAYGQTIGVDAHPVFKTDDNAVYFVDSISYTNDNTENGTAENPYTIGSYSELKNFRAAVNGGRVDICAVLTKDIDVSSETKWAPIGTSANKYTGVFDGKGFEVTGIKSAAGTTQWGFFAYTNGGEIKNLTIKAGNDGVILSGHQSALFVGVAAGDTKITNCAGYGNISVNDGFVGGITSDGACVVTNCYFIGDVTGVNRSSAMGYDAKAYNCFAYGNITATKEENGYAFKISNTKATTNCYYLSSSGVSGTGGYGTQKSAEAFASGEVAYLLNRGAKDILYGQTIGTDIYPVKYNGMNMIYQAGDTYGTSGAFAVIDDSAVTVISTQEACTMVAQYSGDILLSVTPVTVELNKMNKINIQATEGATTYKVFVWNDLKGAIPVCASDMCNVSEI